MPDDAPVIRTTRLGPFVMGAADRARGPDDEICALVKVDRQKMVKIIFWRDDRHAAGDEAMHRSKSAARGRKILETARCLFNRNGHSGGFIEEIMSDAGLAHGGFYQCEPAAMPTPAGPLRSA
jgi:hypothetical protein